MKIKIIQILSCILMLGPITSVSSQQLVTEQNTYRLNGFSINAAAGYLGGESNEYVYDEMGRKLSELNWKINGAAIIKGEVNVDFLPWLTGNARGWSTLDSSNALMDDYDWMNPAQSGWTDWSHHPDTDLNYANNMDFNLRGWFLQKPNYKLGATAGYEQSSFDFLAKGGCYQYNNGLYTGCFANSEPMIGYQQTFETVYLGLTGKYLVNNFELNATVKYGPWVQANDVDQHFARNLVFNESGENSNFSSVTVAAGYHVNPRAKVFFEAAFNQFTNGKADMELNNGIDTYFINNAAGLGNNNYVLALGVQYTPEKT